MINLNGSYWMGQWRPTVRVMTLADPFIIWCHETETELDMLASGSNGYEFAIMNNEFLVTLRWSGYERV